MRPLTHQRGLLETLEIGWPKILRVVCIGALERAEVIAVGWCRLQPSGLAMRQRRIELNQLAQDDRH